jgi:hypothetical protein
MGQRTLRLIARLRRVALLAATVVAAGAMPAGAAVRVDLDLAFFPTSIPPDPIFPAGSLLTGQASFFSAIPGDPTLPQGSPIDIGRVGRGEHFLFSFQPSDPCLGDGSCQLGFSFGGDALLPDGSGFPAGGFPRLGDLSALEGPFLLNGPPILPLDPFEANGPPIRLSGRIVAFDAPVVVGNFAVSLSAVPGVPELGTWAMMIIGFGGVGLQLRRRRGTVALTA